MAIVLPRTFAESTSRESNRNLADQKPGRSEAQALWCMDLGVDSVKTSYRRERISLSTIGAYSDDVTKVTVSPNTFDTGGCRQ